MLGFGSVGSEVRLTANFFETTRSGYYVMLRRSHGCGCALDWYFRVLPHVDVEVIDHLHASATNYYVFTISRHRKVNGYGVGETQLDAPSLLRQLTGVRVKTNSKYGAEQLNT